ncbi:hypothetical protein GM3709_3856 (plasmid) [Geminocystis sp. NIES-3709]|nr:hypothetical protein GM3709_3856 [Geminocystis sp. NIES-3709]
MITEYVDFKESIVKAHHNREESPEAENHWMDLVMADDDKWQELINYIYAEEEEE